jgi:hypothetical protein
VKECVERSAEETDRVHTWLKSAQAKEPFAGTEKNFSGAGTMAKMLAKEQAAALSAEKNALHKSNSNWQRFP